MSKRKIGDAEHARQPFLDDVIAEMVGKDDSKAAPKTFDACRAKVFEGCANVADQLPLEKIAISAFQSQFVIMNDGAAHFPATRPRAST